MSPKVWRRVAALPLHDSPCKIVGLSVSMQPIDNLARSKSKPQLVSS